MKSTDVKRKGGKRQMLSFEHISMAFDANSVLKDVTFTVGDGSLCGLVGHNGAGKTTLLKIAAGILRPDGGTVRSGDIFQRDNEEMKQQVFFLPDEPYSLPQSSLKSTAAFYGGYYPTWNQQTFDRLTELFQLNPRKRLSGFSKGMQRQAFLIIALACQPRILLLDESFDGVDPGKRHLLREVLLEYIAEKEASILISSHNLPELENLCDHIILLDKGRVAYDRDMDTLLSEIRKYRLVFGQPVAEGIFASLPYRNFTRSGNMVTLIIPGKQEETEAALRTLSPLLVESFPLTLEEVFLYEMEETKHDLTGLF